MLWESFRRQRRRKLLAGVAILLGTTAVTAMLALATTIGDRIHRELAVYGANIVVTPLAEELAVKVGGVEVKPSTGGAYLKESDLEKLKTIFWANNITGVSPELSLEFEILDFKGNKVEPSHVVGYWFNHDFGAINTGAPALHPWWKVSGRWPASPQKTDTTSQFVEVAVGSKLAKKHGWHIGDLVNTDITPAPTMTVVGIVASGDSTENELFVPLDIAGWFSGRDGEFDRAEISARTKPEDAFARVDPDSLPAKQREIWYCRPYANSIAYQIREAIPGADAQQVRRVEQSEGSLLGRIGGLMWLVSGAALLAAGFAVSAAMATAVLERRGEIGLMRSLGASRGAIALLFYAETGLLAVVAGGLGYLAGSGLAYWLGNRIFSGEGGGGGVESGAFAGGGGAGTDRGWCGEHAGDSDGVADGAFGNVAGGCLSLGVRRMLLRSLVHRRARSLSALVALTVSAAVATALLTLYGDLDRKLHREFRSFGANVVVTGVGFGVAELGKGQQAAGPEATVAEFAYAVAATDRGTPVVVAGVDFPAVRRLDSWWQVARWPSGTGEALLGAKAAKFIADERAVRLTYAGKAATFAGAGQVRTGGDEDSRIYVPLPAFEAWTGVTPSVMEVQVPGGAAAVEAAMARLRTVLPGARVEPVRQLVEGESRIVERTRALMFGAVLLIALTVAVSVLATLSASVLERRRDFALMKALGGSEGQMMGMFLLETLVLALGGVLVGYCLGSGLAWGIGEVNFGTATLPRLGVLPEALLLNVVIAAVAALLPVRALRGLEPASLLKGE